VSGELEQARLLLRIAAADDPVRALHREAADLLIAAHRENPALTLRDLTVIVNQRGPWVGFDERRLEQLIAWRQNERALSGDALGGSEEAA
jgi:hypothetical protein